MMADVRWRVLGVVVAGVLLSCEVSAGTMEDVVAQLSHRSMDARVTLVVQRNGSEPLYKKISVQVRDSADGQELLMVFQEPSNMKGTGFLALVKQSLEDEYYMYLRTLRRVKRVPNLSENFMLRDFLSLYFLKPRTEIWSFRELGSEEVAGLGAMKKVEGVAKGSRHEDLGGYARLTHWVDPAKKLIMRTEFFDKAGKLVRKQRVTETLKVGKVWVASVFETEDLTEGVSARLEMDEVSLNVTFPEDWFTVRHLKTF